MLVTKHAAELCALLVNDLYGELPSRILIALLTKGRSTIAQLVQYTSLTPRHLRNGLAVLIQQNLLYHHTNQDTNVISYEANAGACYSLVRSGKILEIVDRQYGTAERELVQTLMLLGHARIADLAQAFGSRAPKTNGHMNGNHDSHSGLIESENHLNSVLGRLLRAEIIETARPDSFRNPTDVRREIEDDVLKTAPGEKAASKNKAESQRQIIDRLRTFRDQGRMLKRQLDATGGFVSKRRKLENGRTQNGHSYEEEAPQINPNVIVRLNHERCLVELRNQRLTDLAADVLGEVTGEVYRAALDLLTTEFSRCRPDALLDEETNGQQVSVTSVDILDHLDESINVQSGIGKAAKDKIDSESAERVRTAPPDDDYDSDDSDAAPPGRRPVLRTFDIGDDDDEDDENPSGAANGDRETKVKFEGAAAPKDSRLSQMRQHLLLLAESKNQFIRHCGTFGRGQWTVDFSQLMERLRETELDAMIEQCHGRYGLRLTRILREKGKLDEKMLPSAALMKKGDVQGKMLAMQMAGLVDVQEVPRDNSRLANRTLFFWFFDKERSQSQALDDIYKAMVRCLQTLQVERHKERNILSFVERKDVQGKEEEVMTAEHYNKYNMHLEVQNKLLGQVMKLDELVAMLRDY
ncbi:RNA polymerase III subunit RPC82-domain-containing protein [Dactylonectria estremocensis]|uniref:DNA-directed RNA polymerase III subunit RPC3 n=1 Tax=Dactylonectria estremocensis TaxID=1079267 RepID=A0A9P9F5T8_9HYPO|nr:RNA polymerase III subunit RPC82-domain-containing protein [Dactylonectria estremocensis]